MVDRTDVNRNTRRQPHWNGKNPAQIPDAAPRSRTALNPVAYDNLIKQHGVRVKVYRSMYCPNVKSVDGGEHNIDCTLCNGSGYLDIDPLETVAYLNNQNFQEEMTVEGYHDGNTVGATFLGGVELQYFTRVDLMDFTQPFYERVLRKENTAFPTLPLPPTISVTFPATPLDNSLSVFNDAISSMGLFEIVTPGTSTGGVDSIPTAIVVGDSIPNNVPNGAILHNASSVINEIFFKTRETPRTGTDWVNFLVNQINSITENAAGTQTTAGSNISAGATIRRNCIASVSPTDPNTLILTSNTTNITNITQGFSSGDVVNIIFNGAAAVIANDIEDNLKYDCRRVNVIIDKLLEQYHQDIDFVLTPQGNVQWLVNGRRPADNAIYTVHYESVIQYRTITAQHINRFAQVPDRNTGLVAQVKLPEQWMMQKEFLIKRRDQYGAEIKATGIYGDVIAAQPLNPAPADTL